MGAFFARLSSRLERARLSVLAKFGSHADLVAMVFLAAICFGWMAGSLYFSGEPERLPMTLLYTGSVPLMFGLPVMLVWAHRRRQHRTILKVRGLYAVAIELLMKGRVKDAQRALQSIRRWEHHWRIGNSRIYRLAYTAFVIAATTLIAALHYFAYANVYSHWGYGQVPHKTIADTVRNLLEHPIQLWILGILSLMYGFTSIEHLKDLGSAPWSEFYGDRLEAALKAGRSIDGAPRYDSPPPDMNISARELLGLSETFTSAQLRRAWLSLVLELHPDRWAMAGEDVQRIKEAALKRVNAARDELVSQATG